MSESTETRRGRKAIPEVLPVEGNKPYKPNKHENIEKWFKAINRKYLFSANCPTRLKYGRY